MNFSIRELSTNLYNSQFGDESALRILSFSSDKLLRAEGIPSTNSYLLRILSSSIDFVQFCVFWLAYNHIFNFCVPATWPATYAAQLSVGLLLHVGYPVRYDAPHATRFLLQAGV